MIIRLDNIRPADRDAALIIVDEISANERWPLGHQRCLGFTILSVPPRRLRGWRTKTGITVKGYYDDYTT